MICGPVYSSWIHDNLLHLFESGLKEHNKSNLYDIRAAVGAIFTENIDEMLTEQTLGDWCHV